MSGGRAAKLDEAVMGILANAPDKDFTADEVELALAGGGFWANKRMVLSSLKRLQHVLRVSRCFGGCHWRAVGEEVRATHLAAISRGNA